MVLIPIRSPLVSLCITIISVVCELAFLTAALSFLRYRACRRLEKHKAVPIRAQHKLVLAVTLIAMLLFVTLETITSIFSDPITRQIIEIQPCVRNILGATNDELPNESEAIHFACTIADGTTVTHFEGNFSTTTRNITCGARPIYSYIIGKNVSLPVDGAVSSCAFRTCAFVLAKNDTLYLSGVHKPTDEIITYLPTALNPKDIQLLDLDFIAESLADDFANSRSEEGEIRRRALLGSIKSECPFTRDDGPATTIPLGVIIGAGVIWVSSFLFFFASLFVRKKIFFDITHPMHWARKARHDLRRATGNDPELEMVKVDGELLITVTGYMPNRVD